jgi:hypothetical protein
MRLHLHVPGASPEQFARGLAAAVAVIAAGTEDVQQVSAGDVSKEVASLHALAEHAAATHAWNELPPLRDVGSSTSRFAETPVRTEVF